MRRVGKLTAGAAALAVTAGLTASCGFAEASPFATVQNFLIAWQVENFAAAASHTTGTPEKDVVAQLAAVRPELDATSLRPSLQSARIVHSGDGYDARFTVNVDLGQNGDPWIYQSQMHLKRVSGLYKIVWSPSVIHPSLDQGERLAIVTTSQPRQPILDAEGQPIAKASPSVRLVGIYPGRLSSDEIDAAVTELAKVLPGLDAARLEERAASAPPDKFLQLALVDTKTQTHVLARLKAIKSLILQPTTEQIYPSMAQQLVGDLGTATTSDLQEVGAPYQLGDIIGVSGLQMLFQRRLASTPIVQIVVQDSDGRKSEPLATWMPKDTAQPLQTTLESDFQQRAERALASLNVPMPASMVAVRAIDGNIVAVANQGTDADLALTGKYLPGQTFGIISAEALLTHNVDPSTAVNCASTGGGNSTFETAFGKPCGVPALESLSDGLDAQSLLQTAGSFGIGRDLGLSPVQTYAGQISAPATDKDRAALAAGQSNVLVSPLNMALAAASVSYGSFRPPVLLSNGTSGTGQPQVLDGPSIGKLQTMMQRAATTGPAKAAGLRGAGAGGITTQVTDASGKTVSWFVGYSAGVAFAIAIEGKANAAKIAHAFLHS